MKPPITSRPAYAIGICALWNSYIHGQTEASSPSIPHHWIVEHVVPLEDVLTDLVWFHDYKRQIQNRPPLYDPKLEIVQIKHLSGGECVAIMKTVWLRIFQRTYRRRYRARHHV